MHTQQDSSQLAEVTGGAIEFATAGVGPTVLVSHGTLGGFDQALAISQLFDQEKFRFLAVSRAGYLRSSPKTGRTPEEQARSLVELLDHQGVPSAAVMGLSGGGPAAIHFAQNYPERCWALVLISSIASAPPPLPLFFRVSIRTQNITMRFDALWSLVYRYGLKLLIRTNGVEPEQIDRIFQDPRLLSVAQGIYQPITSSSARLEGFLLDDAQITSLPAETSYTVNAPTLICHAANDPIAPAQDAARFARSLPDAEYLETPDGGHIFFVVHSEQVVPKIEEFLLAKAPE